MNFISRRGRQTDTTRTRIYSTTLSTTLDDGPDEPVIEGGQQRPAEANGGTAAPFLLAAPGRGHGHGHEHEHEQSSRSTKPETPHKEGRACGLAGLLKAPGARLERRGEAPNLQKPPREELKPHARWRAKGRECVRENTPVPLHNTSVGASQSPPKTCGCAALEGQLL